MFGGNVGVYGAYGACIYMCGKVRQYLTKSALARCHWKIERGSDDSLDGSVDGLQHVFAHGTLVARGTLAVHENSHGNQDGRADPQGPHKELKSNIYYIG